MGVWRDAYTQKDAAICECNAETRFKFAHFTRCRQVAFARVWAFLVRAGMNNAAFLRFLGPRADMGAILSP